MKDNDNVVVINEGVKKRGRGGKYNFPSTVEPEDPEVVRAAMGSVLYWYRRGNDSPCTNDEEVQDRVDEYILECYQTGQRMTVEKLALALGVTRETLHSWETGATQSKRRSDIIKRAKDTIASYDADMVTSGKMNPVPYIFRAKNYYGMKDQQEITIEPKQSTTYDLAEEDIKKFAELPED